MTRWVRALVCVAALVSACRGKPQRQTEGTGSARTVASTEPQERIDPPVKRSPSAVLDSYLRVARCRDRLAFIADAGIYKNDLLAFYEDDSLCTATPEALDDSRCELPRCFVRAKIKQRKPFDACMVDTADGWRVDWPCTAGFNGVPLSVVKASMPVGKAAFRVHAKLDDYYNFAFRRARKTHYSLRIEDARGTSMHAYAPKTDAAQPLFRLLTDGNGHPVSLELEYPEGASESSTIGVTRVLSLDWFYDPKTEKAP